MELSDSSLEVAKNVVEKGFLIALVRKTFGYLI